MSLLVWAGDHPVLAVLLAWAACDLVVRIVPWARVEIREDRP